MGKDKIMRDLLRIAIFVIFVTLVLLVAAIIGYGAAAQDQDVDVGMHGWGYVLDTAVSYDQDEALISVLIPYQMVLEGISWSQLVDAAGYAGPAESKFYGLARAADGAAGKGANTIVYVPEGITTSPSVPIEETINLEKYVELLVNKANQHGYIVTYGPSLELVSDPDTWAYGKFYDLQEDRVSNLASMLPDGSLWIFRMFTPEVMYRNDLAGFGNAVREYADAVHAGNPTIKIVLHLSCPAGSEDSFMRYLDAARPYIFSAYAGIDPVRDKEGTIATVREILARTGELPVGTVTDTPTFTPTPTSTDTPTPTPTPTPTFTPTPTPTPTPTFTPTPVPTTMVYYNIKYGDNVRHVLDLYVPGTSGPHPVVVWLHGGGLTSGDKSMVRTQAHQLANAGFAVIAANYRLTTQVPPAYLPEQDMDAKAVVRWARCNASKYNLDGDNVGAIGGSAGAFLSTNLGSSGGVSEVEGTVGYCPSYSSTVQASVGLAGVYNFRAYFAGLIRYCSTRPYDDPVCLQDGDSTGKGAFFMCYLSDPACLERVDNASAYYHVGPGDPPSLVAIGTLDATPNGLADHQAYHDAMLSAGVDSTLIVVEGAEHGELLPDIMPTLIQFFTEHLR